MFDSLRRRLHAGERVSRQDVTHLWHEADDATLSELATVVRDRWHAPGTATWLKMAIINTTNVCVARCDYCAFYREPGAADAYTLTLDQIAGRVESLRRLGGTLVGFNGGFHPDLRTDDYARLFRAVRERFPDVTFYEMTVAEFLYVAMRSRQKLPEAAAAFAAAGTQWITGGGAEILDDAFRQRHSPGKFSVRAYFQAQRAVLDAGMGSTATMVIGFDETLEERLNHLESLRDFQDEVGGALPSFLCWTYKPWNNALGGQELATREYLRWLAVSRIFLDNFKHIRTSVLTRNADALLGLRFGADDFDLPTEDEVTTKAGATISHDFEGLLRSGRELGFSLREREPLQPRSP